PKVVFLDEMTTGLDPAARRVTWDLIRAIRDRGTTVILVTHFMDEAENLCDRIGIMNNGKLAALDTPHNLINIHANLIKVIFSTERTDIDWLKSVPHVHNLSRHGQRIEVEGDGPVLALVASELVKHGIVPVDLRKEQPSLEDVFLKITWVELKLFFREPLTLVFSFALPVVFLLVMGGVFGNKPDTSSMHIYRG